MGKLISNKDELDDDLEIEEYDDFDDEFDDLDEEHTQANGFKDKIAGFFSSFSKKKNEDDDDEYEDDEEEDVESDRTQTIKEKLDKTLNDVLDKSLPAIKNALKKKKASDTEDLELEDTGPKKKVQVSKGVVIVLGGALVGIILSLDMEEEVPPPKPRAKVNKVRPKPQPKKVETVVKKEEIEEPIPTGEVEETETPEIKVKKEEILKDVVVAPKTESLNELKGIVPEPEPESSIETEELAPVVETNVEEKVSEVEAADTLLENLETQNKVDETLRPEMDEFVSDEEDSVEKNKPSVSKTEDQSPEKVEEIIPQEDFESDISTEITKKLLSDLEVRLKEEKQVQKMIVAVKPTSAPSYEAIGRSLVYNCKDKHWACIEEDDFNICRKNYSWNKREGIPLECYPVAALDNDYDCSVVQQEKIDSVSDTSFCSE